MYVLLLKMRSTNRLQYGLGVIFSTIDDCWFLFLAGQLGSEAHHLSVSV